MTNLLQAIKKLILSALLTSQVLQASVISTTNVSTRPIARPRPPTANNSSVRTKPDREVFINLTADNPSDLGMTFTIVSQPTHGTLTDWGFIAYSGVQQNAVESSIVTAGPIYGGLIDLPTSSFQKYTPAAGFVGTDSFTFIASNAAGDSGLATVSITVTADNLAPEATAAAYTVKLGEKLWINLSGTDPDNDPLTYSIATQPQHGTLRAPTSADFSGVIEGDLTELYPFDPIPGFYIYEPTVPQTLVALPDDWSSADSFTFTANDGTVDSIPATIAITIKPVNRAPIAVLAVTPAIQAWTSNGTTVVIANNNKTAEVTLDGLSSTDADGDILWADWYELIVHGKPSPKVRLAATEQPLAWGLAAPASLKIGTHTITGRVTDGSAESAATFSVTVISPAAAVRRLSLALRSFGAPGPYRAKLANPIAKAMALCAKGKFPLAIDQLGTFKTAVQTHLATQFPNDAARLTDLADAIIEALIPMRPRPVLPR